MDTSWYLDVNDFARNTTWAHGFMSAYAGWAGVGLLGVMLLAGGWWARFDSPKAVAAAIWAAAGTLVAVGLNQPLGHLVGRTRPYDTIHGVEVLVPRAHDFTFPSDHATAAGAVICGLFLAGRRRLGSVATLVGALLAFSRVYVGAHYPTDVIGGLVFGAAVVALLFPLAVGVVLLPAVRWVGRSPLRVVVQGRRDAAPASPAGSGTVDAVEEPNTS